MPEGTAVRRECRGVLPVLCQCASGSGQRHVPSRRFAHRGRGITDRVVVPADVAGQLRNGSVGTYRRSHGVVAAQFDEDVAVGRLADDDKTQ